KAKNDRRGIAAVELGIMLPFLAFMFCVAVDWGRIFYYSQTVTNCARNAALYMADPYSTCIWPYADVTAAAVADAPNLSPAPTVTTATGSDSYGTYVDCTVDWTFHTVSGYLPTGLSNITLSRTVRVYQAPQVPN